MEAGWFYSPTQIIRYFATRISSLKPPQVSKTVLCESGQANKIRINCGTHITSSKN